MHKTTYLIVGAGMTGDMAAKGIREHDSDGSITMIGADPHPTYKRPPLTKGLWKGSPEDKIWREPAEGVELVTGRRVVSLDLAAQARARSRAPRGSSGTARSTTTTGCARRLRRDPTSP
jgi:NAD(P)H-nitrite reductase large subunit